MHLDIAICLPREAETVALVRSAVADTLRHFGIETDCVEDIRLAVSEACTNVIDHASTDDEYEVQVHVNAHRCAIDVRNTGDGFDSAALAGIEPYPLSARGRGVAIMKAVMDSVRFSSERESGTIVHLVRDLQVRPGSRLGRLQRATFPGSTGESA